MTDSERQSRMIISVVAGAASPGLQLGLPLVAVPKPEGIAAFVNLLRTTADAMQEQLDIITGAEIDEVIERSKRP